MHLVNFKLRTDFYILLHTNFKIVTPLRDFDILLKDI